jgi:hypothetical protein
LKGYSKKQCNNLPRDLSVREETGVWSFSGTRNNQFPSFETHIDHDQLSGKGEKTIEEQQNNRTNNCL